MLQTKIPQEIEEYILEFLQPCSYCNILQTINQCRTCVFCKRSWCNNCYKNYRLIDYSYFEVYVMTCKNCLYQVKSNSYITI